MVDQFADWPVERRTLPPHLEAVAAAQPGGVVAEIDGSLAPDPDGYVPAEAVVGCFVVGADGRATGEYLRNPGHGPVRDDFTRLESPDHWLGWLPDTPAAAVRGALADLLGDQVPGTVVEWVKVTDDPVFLTGGRRDPERESMIIVVRAALAVPFALSALPPTGDRAVLTGVLSWVMVGLDTADGARQQLWLDLGMDREQAEELLQERVYAVRAA